MHSMTPWELAQLALVVFLVSFVIVARLLRTYNNPARATKRGATPAVLAWALLALAPVTLAVIVAAAVAWAVFECLVILTHGIVDYTHMGKSRTPQQ